MTYKYYSGRLVGQPAAEGIGNGTNTAHQLGLRWGLVGAYQTNSIEMSIKNMQNSAIFQKQTF